MPSADFLKTIEDQLTYRQKSLEDQIRSLKEGDPILAEMVFIPTDIGDSSWESEVHTKTVVVSQSLSALYQNVQKSLQKIKEGTYGLCEKCGERIGHERLQVLPTATHCNFCL